MIRLCSVIGENDSLLEKYLNHYTELGVEFFSFFKKCQGCVDHEAGYTNHPSDSPTNFGDF